MISVTKVRDNTIEIAINYFDVKEFLYLGNSESWELFKEIIDSLEYLVPFLNKPRQVKAITHLAETAGYLNKICNEEK